MIVFRLGTFQHIAMATILFDKMQAARRLEAEGKFTREQAETLAEVYHDAMTEAVATKTDLHILDSKLTTRIDILESKLFARIAEIETRIAETQTRMITAMIGLFIAAGIVQHFWR